MYKSYVVALTCFLSACGGGGDSTIPDIGGRTTSSAHVYIDDGAVQCEQAPLAPEETAQILIDQGIDVLSSRCGVLDVAMPDVCGALTAGIHIHRINRQNLPDADGLGFENLAEIDGEYESRPCPTDVEVVDRPPFDATSYAFNYRETGFSPLGGEWNIRVMDGQVDEVNYLGTDEPASRLTVDSAPTIVDLVDRVQACAAAQDCEITELMYDDTDFYPSTFSASSGEEGSGFVVSGFGRL